MLQYSIVLVILIICSIVYIKLATKFKILDNPNARSSHKSAVIRGGGVLFYIAIILFFIFSNFQFPLFFIGVTILAIISFIDDIYTLSVKQRLPFHFMGITFLLMETVIYDISMLWFVVFILIGVIFVNLYNFMDGINGMTGFYSILFISSILYVNKIEYIINQDILTYTLIGTVVFGFYNFRKKARFFAGDVGSITMATFVFFICFWFISNLKAPILILLVSVYIIDSGLTVLVRFVQGENIVAAHRKHIYERITDVLKLNHLHTSLIYVALQSIINIYVIHNYNTSFINQYTIIIVVLLLLIIIYGSVIYILERKSKKI